jgi:hypothetical protein
VIDISPTIFAVSSIILRAFVGDEQSGRASADKNHFISKIA